MKSRTVEGTTNATGFQRALSWIMAVVMAVSLMPLPAYAAGSENATGGGSSLQGAPAGLTALSLNTQSFETQSVDGYLYVPSSENTSAKSQNVTTYGTSAYGSTQSWKNGFEEMLYLSSEIGSEARIISSIAYYVWGSDYSAGNKKWTDASVKVYLAETDKSSIASYNDLVDSADATLVYEGTTTLGGTYNEWQELEFNKSTFAYSGTKNLVVIFMASGGTRDGAAIITANQENANKGWSFYDDKNEASFTNYASLKDKIQSLGSTVDDTSYKSGVNANRPSVRFGYTTPVQATGAISLDPNTMNLAAGQEAGTSTVTYNGDGTFSVSSSDESVATASLLGTTLTVTPVAEGNATITVSAPATENYTAATATLPVSVTNNGEATHLSFAEQVSDGGYGSENNPYEIYNETDLEAFRDAINSDTHKSSGDDAKYLGKYFKLMNDIELSKAWVPIGPSGSYYFSAHFDGQYHTISNVYGCTATSGSYYGFFGYVRAAASNASVKNLRIVGRQGDGADIDAGAVTGKNVGGIIGYTGASNYRITVDSCISNMSLAGCRNIGGIVGSGCQKLDISNCLALGDITPTDTTSSGTASSSNTSGCCGGLVGVWSGNDASMRNCLYAGQMSTTNFCQKGNVGAQYKTHNALVGKLGSNATATSPTLTNALFVPQEDTAIKAYRMGGTDVIAPVELAATSLEKSIDFSAAQSTLGDGWIVNGTSIAPNGFAASAGYVVEAPAADAFQIAKTEATNGTYTVKVGDDEVTEAAKDATVVITPTPAANFQVDAVTVTDADSNTVSTTESGGAYSFTMPAKAVTVTVTFKAASNKINVPTAVTGLSYTGNAQTVVAGGTGYTLAFAEGAPSDAAVDASGNATLTNATESSLAVTATLKSGYTWSDDSADAKTIDVSMGKGANPAMTVAPATVSLLDTETTGKTSTVSYAGTGELSARSANDGVATATVSGSNVTIIPVAAGETAVTVTAAAGSNYTAASTATINVTVVDASTLTVKVTPLAKGSALQADANYIITSRSASDNAVMGVSGTTQSARTATIDEAAETIAFSSATDKEESIWTAEASGESFKLKTAGGKYLGIAATGLSINDSGTDLIWKDFYNGENDYSSVQTKTVLHSTMYGYVKYESGIFSQLLNSQPSSAAAKIWKVVDTTARNITVPNGITGGTVAVDKKQAAENDVVTVTVTPDTGYEIDKVTYTPEGGSTTPIEAKDGAYTFAMPAANVAVSATFKLKSYTITWTDDEGKTIKTTEVAHGTVPAFGDDPEKAGTDQYTYTFDSWDPVPVAATQNATYKAKFTSTVNKYTVKFVNEDGAELQSSEVEYGATPTYNGNTPTKEATSEYTYKFKGWDSEIAAVTGDATYTAQFEAIPIDQPTTEKFKVTFVDEDGETVLKAAEYAEGTAAADIVKPVDPTKAPTAEYEYAFDKWVNAADDSEMAVVTQDVTYKATYTATKRSYTVTFKNGSATLQSAPVEYGATPAYTGETPTKAADAEYTYEFEGWEPELASVTCEATYTAKFKATPIDQPATDKFTVTFVDEDGTVLKAATEYAEGTAAADIAKPADPAKASTAEFDYAFAGWSPEIAPVTANATYKATYTAKKRSYTVTFKNGDQTLQSTSVEYGAMPAYAGATPAKAADSQHTYVFKGWTPAIAKVTGNATYAAEFTALTKVAKPTAKSFTYDGATKSIVAGKGYSLTGTKSAVNAGTYKATAKLSSGYVWADGTTSDVTVSWSIGKAKVAKPAGKSYTYDGTTKTGVAAGAGYTLTGVDKASNAGTYSATAKLDSNHAWSDGSSASAVISWKVSPASIAKAAIAKVVAMTYTGKALTPTPKVTLSGKQLALNADYTLSYAGNKNAGTAAITVTGKGNYTGTAKSSFTIKKAASKLTVKAKKTLTVSKSAAKTVFNAKNVWKTTKNTSKGAVSYKKASGDKRIAVASNGKVTVKKGLKKGKTYTVKVKATSKATGNYKAASSTVKLKVKVK